MDVKQHYSRDHGDDVDGRRGELVMAIHYVKRTSAMNVKRCAEGRMTVVFGTPHSLFMTCLQVVFGTPHSVHDMHAGSVWHSSLCQRHSYG